MQTGSVNVETHSVNVSTNIGVLGLLCLVGPEMPTSGNVQGQSKLSLTVAYCTVLLLTVLGYPTQK